MANKKVLEIGFPKRINKAWGYEDVIYNGEDYCGKILHYNTGRKSSGHLHINKRESWLVASGIFKLSYINMESSEKLEKILIKGMTINIDPGCFHQLECVEEGDIFEASGHHEDSDTYRFTPGDGQSNLADRV